LSGPGRDWSSGAADHHTFISLGLLSELGEEDGIFILCGSHRRRSGCRKKKSERKKIGKGRKGRKKSEESETKCTDTVALCCCSHGGTTMEYPPLISTATARYRLEEGPATENAKGIYFALLPRAIIAPVSEHVGWALSPVAQNKQAKKPACQWLGGQGNIVGAVAVAKTRGASRNSSRNARRNLLNAKDHHQAGPADHLQQCHLGCNRRRAWSGRRRFDQEERRMTHRVGLAHLSRAQETDFGRKWRLWKKPAGLGAREV
jgi:hypothetical protein